MLPQGRTYLYVRIRVGLLRMLAPDKDQYLVEMDMSYRNFLEWIRRKRSNRHLFKAGSKSLASSTMP